MDLLFDSLHLIQQIFCRDETFGKEGLFHFQITIDATLLGQLIGGNVNVIVLLGGAILFYFYLDSTHSSILLCFTFQVALFFLETWGGVTGVHDWVVVVPGSYLCVSRS